jgi:hypothetical protein
VDVNDLAAELAKVSLWLEALEPGKPLSFLDARIRVGNSLLGTTPALLEGGIPDLAFKELEGDDNRYAATIRGRNRAEATGQDVLVFGDLSNKQLATDRARVLTLTDDVNEVRRQAQQLSSYEQSAGYLARKIHANTWCAAFVWPLQHDFPEPPTNGIFRAIGDNPNDPNLAKTIEETERLADEFRFFQWHLEFPEIFQVNNQSSASSGPEGWSGGFSCLVGNPPWERVKLQEQEFFAARDPEIASAPNAAARRRLIAALANSASVADRALHAEFLAARRHAEGQSAILRTSGRYPLAGRGDVNTYAVFAEAFRTLTRPHGRSGVIVPTGIATDATTQYFFKDMVEKHSLAALYDFENAAPIFPDVHRSFKFCLLTITGREQREDAASFAFFLHDPELIAISQFALIPEEITLLNPNTGTCPVFRTRRDAEITLDIYRRVPILVREGDPNGNPWGISFMTMFHMTNDAKLFRTRDQLEDEGWVLRGNVFERSSEYMLPLYEGRMGHQFEHRYELIGSEDNEARTDPDVPAVPEFWVALPGVVERLHRRRFLCRTALLGHRRVARNTDERTAIAAFIPFGAASYGWIITAGPQAPNLTFLEGAYNSFVYDYCLRNKLTQASIPISTSEQIPVPPHLSVSRGLAPWDPGDSIVGWIQRRVLELTYTAWDMEPFARDLGDGGPPFRWDSERRSLLRAELDAAFFHLYGVTREDADYILDTFPIVRRKNEQRFGEYRTKRLILEIYDAMHKAMDTAAPYKTVLDPPPSEGPRHTERARVSRDD